MSEVSEFLKKLGYSSNVFEIHQQIEALLLDDKITEANKICQDLLAAYGCALPTPPKKVRKSKKVI
jgi:hypothetical protein